MLIFQEWNKKDINLALELYKKAADQNLSEAQYNLANIYSDGSLVKQDNEKALELYTKVAEKGVPEAQNNLAYMYANVYSDYKKLNFGSKKLPTMDMSQQKKP